MKFIAILILRFMRWRQYRYLKSLRWARNLALEDGRVFGHRLRQEEQRLIELTNRLNRLTNDQRSPAQWT